MYVITKDKVLCHNLREKKCVLVIKIFFLFIVIHLYHPFVLMRFLYIYIYIYIYCGTSVWSFPVYFNNLVSRPDG
jgi:hypothetical protein